MGRGGKRGVKSKRGERDGGGGENGGRDAMLLITLQSIEISLTEDGYIYIVLQASLGNHCTPLFVCMVHVLTPHPPVILFQYFFYECFIGRVVLVAKTW